MSHTLHREGDRDSLSNDYIFLIMPENGFNDENSEERLRLAMDVLLKHNPVNFGDSKNGSKYTLHGKQAVLDAIEEKETIFAVYTTIEQVTAVLRDLKELDTGLSVTVSGLADQLCSCARKAGLTPHTVSESLGVWGDQERLPPAPVRELTTMCGHGLVAANLVFDLLERVKTGRLTTEQAAEKMAECCVCGVFNPVRAQQIIEGLLKSETEKSA